MKNRHDSHKLEIDQSVYATKSTNRSLCRERQSILSNIGAPYSSLLQERLLRIILNISRSWNLIKYDPERTPEAELDVYEDFGDTPSHGKFDM